jgi:hypothetical protein
MAAFSMLDGRQIAPAKNFDRSRIWFTEAGIRLSMPAENGLNEIDLRDLLAIPDCALRR